MSEEILPSTPPTTESSADVSAASQPLSAQARSGGRSDDRGGHRDDRSGGGRRDARQSGGGDRRGGKPGFEPVKKEFEEVLLQVSRVTKVTSGGRQLRFRAAVVIGDRAGRV